MASLDRAYTDMQIEDTLEHHCMLDEEFDPAVDHGFHNASACKDFAHSLMAARMQDLAAHP